MKIDISKLDSSAASGTLTGLDAILRRTAMLVQEAAGSIRDVNVTLSQDAFGQAMADAESRGIVDGSNARNPVIAPLYATWFSIVVDVASPDGVHLYEAHLGVHRSTKP